MSTAAPAKFTFDLDMSLKREKNRVMPEQEFAAAVTTARAEGYAEGHAEGQKGELARAAQALLVATESIARQAAQLAAASDAMRKQAMGEAVMLANSISRKLAGHLMAREPAAELETLISDCLASLGEAPHLVIRCHPELADQIRETAETLMATSGFSGRLVVMGEPEIALHDGRIEWVDGGLVRDTAAVEAEIDRCIEGYFKSNGITNAGETE